MTEVRTHRIEIYYDEEHAVFVAEMPELPARSSVFRCLSAFGGTREEALGEVQVAENRYYRHKQRRKALGIRG